MEKACRSPIAQHRNRLNRDDIAVWQLPVSGEPPPKEYPMYMKDTSEQGYSTPSAITNQKNAPSSDKEKRCFRGKAIAHDHETVLGTAEPTQRVGGEIRPLADLMRARQKAGSYANWTMKTRESEKSEML